MLYLANTEAPPIQNKNANALGIRATKQTTPLGTLLTLLTSLPAAGGEADAPTFFVFLSSIPYPRRFVNWNFTFFLDYFVHNRRFSGHTDPVPIEKEVPHMEERKNTKNEQNTTEQNIPNTGKNTKNTKNAKNCK